MISCFKYIAVYHIHYLPSVQSHHSHLRDYRHKIIHGSDVWFGEVRSGRNLVNSGFEDVDTNRLAIRNFLHQ
jgi:hypothetical protein